MNDDELIQREIEIDRYHPGPADVRLRGSGVHVWAIIGYYHAVDHDVLAVMRDYEIPREEVEAALAYYRRHQAVIDGRLESNQVVTAD